MSTNDINKVVVIGRLVKSPELKKTKAGISATNISLANNRVYVQNGTKNESVSYFDCSAWNATAETICKYCHKGDRVCVEGRLQQQRWEDKNGVARTTINIIIESIQFLSGKNEGQKHTEPEADENPFADEPVF